MDAMKTAKLLVTSAAAVAVAACGSGDGHSADYRAGCAAGRDATGLAPNADVQCTGFQI
jgi:hypothetical protein